MKGDNMTEVDDPSLWWKQAVVYQVYPRSFKDSRGEGLGQIAGVTEKIGYLKELGVDAIWLSPFYPSQLADGGYDVDDYRNVDPKLGTMDDFDALAKAAHADGIKIVVDIVPNHSSNLHEWFKAALAAKPGSPERDRYIFRDGKGPNGDEPPTNWQNHFGGPAWTRVPDGQWYLHMFTKEQPDWNWKTRTCAPISSKPCVSGLTTVPTASAWTWRTAWPRISTAMIWTIMWSGAPTISPKTAPIR